MKKHMAGNESVGCLSGDAFLFIILPIKEALQAGTQGNDALFHPWCGGEEGWASWWTQSIDIRGYSRVFSLFLVTS